MARPPKERLFDRLLREAECHIWRKAIDRCQGNVSTLAKWMETDSIWTRRRLKVLGLQEYVQEARLDRREAAAGGNGARTEV